MGTTVRELIELAGGVIGGAAVGAVQPGGASSNFIGPDQLDMRARLRHRCEGRLDARRRRRRGDRRGHRPARRGHQRAALLPQRVLRQVRAVAPVLRRPTNCSGTSSIRDRRPSKSRHAVGSSSSRRSCARPRSAASGRWPSDPSSACSGSTREVPWRQNRRSPPSPRRERTRVLYRRHRVRSLGRVPPVTAHDDRIRSVGTGLGTGRRHDVTATDALPGFPGRPSTASRCARPTRTAPPKDCPRTHPAGAVRMGSATVSRLRPARAWRSRPAR